MVCPRVLLLLLLMAVAVALRRGRAEGESATTARHHCVHDEMARRLGASVDAASRVVPQRLESEAQSPRDATVDAFLDVVGYRRRLTSTPLAKDVKPFRIAFDLSKLSSDPGRMCTREGELVRTDGGGVYRCASGDVLTPIKRDFIVSVLLKAIEDYFESTLSVRSVVGNLVVKGLSCSPGDDWACCASAVPKKFKTDGVANADFVLHVTARPTTGATIAWALPCNLDQYGRPISGQANFGPGRLDPVTPSARTEQIGAALHEMTHALVFSRGRFADFRQPLNGPRWGYNNVVSQSQGAGGIWVSKIITPSVVRQAKQQFNCFDWVNAGLELENGDSGSADFSSHWEKRLLMNEYMTATSSYDPVYSALTLALFEDSGWYQVNFKNAQVLPWGYMEGCGVAQGRCSKWNSRYVCNDVQQTACTADFTSKAYCNVASYMSSIPAGFQYFQNPSYGGRDAFTDYCPFYRAYSNGDCRGIGRAATAVNTGNYMEEVGLNSRCFQSSLSRTSSQSAAQRPSCYKVIDCSSEGLRLSVGGKTVLCPADGGEIRVSGFKGVLLCPPAGHFCKLLRDKCSGNGALLSSGECECKSGFVGDDCSGIACPVSSLNHQECGGSKQGTCDNSTGKCKCSGLYTGLSCSELVCPVSGTSKNTSECSGHGDCDRAYGRCTCNDGYSGKSCECVPGCSSASCGSNGSCDCTTGGCSCAVGFSGVNCSERSDPYIQELDEDMPTVTDTIADKEYKYYKIYLSSSTYDITFSLLYKNKNGKGTDVDLYGSFLEKYPTSLTAKSSLLVSDFSVGDRDEVNLCGSLGTFPRGVNDTFRHCARPTSSYLLETPGYFYLSVFGYAGGEYELAIVTDKCKNVTCSNHGLCGVNYPGVCTCDRYWTGDDCSIPQCGPDCQDLGTCRSASSSSSKSETMHLLSSGSSSVTTPTTTSPTNETLLRPPECYGNGVCRIDPTTDAPRCVCGDAFTYINPSAQQAMCKELLPSVSSIQAFTEPFDFSTLDNDEVLDVNAWALFSIVIKDDWEMLAVNVAIHADETDVMLVMSKAKLPSMLLMSAQQASYSAPSTSASAFLEFMDLEGWMSKSTSRKLILSRASATLASGLYYIGVSNSVYALNPLAYTLKVQATRGCSALANESHICSNGGTCNPSANQLCACADGYFGQYCDYQSSSTMLSAPSPVILDPSTHSIPNNTTTTGAPATDTGAPYIAYRSPDVQTLAVGEWAYFSFGISDPATRVVQFRMTMLDDRSNTTRVFPLLLVRGPLDVGFPTLYTQNLQDFGSVSRRDPAQAVSLVVKGQCEPTQSPTGCYKVAMFNREYSRDALRYRLEVELFPSLDTLFTDTTCGSDAHADGVCHGNGKCVMSSWLNTTSNPVNHTTPRSPTCTCRQGWTGALCDSPTMFDAPHLWSEINATSQLCETCNTTFPFTEGDLRIFRVPANASSGSGLRLRVRAPSVLPAEEPLNETTPVIYVSEVMPRSMYDFTYISVANASFGGDQVVDVPVNTLSEYYWVVVFSGYPETIEPTASTTALPYRTSRRLSASQTRVASSDRSSVAQHVFTLEAEPLGGSTPSNGNPPANAPSSHASAWHWLFHSLGGLVVVSASIVSAVLSFCMCAYRRWKKSTRRADPQKDTAEPTVTTGSDIELGTSTARVRPRPAWYRVRFRASESPTSLGS